MTLSPSVTKQQVTLFLFQLLAFALDYDKLHLHSRDKPDQTPHTDRLRILLSQDKDTEIREALLHLSRELLIDGVQSNHILHGCNSVAIQFLIGQSMDLGGRILGLKYVMAAVETLKCVAKLIEQPHLTVDIMQ